MSETLTPASAAFSLPAPRVAINPWFIAITVTLATFMEFLDTAIANVALPHIAGGLAVSTDESTWVLTSYLVSNAVVLPLSAWLSRIFGRKRYYMICVALFTVSSLLCGFAPSLGMLIFFRVLQGVGGGGLAPVEQAILVDTFPAGQTRRGFCALQHGHCDCAGHRPAARRLDHRSLELALGLLHQHSDRHCFVDSDQPAALRSAGVHARGGSGAQGRQAEDRWLGNFLRGHGVCVPGSGAGSRANRRLVRKQLHHVFFFTIAMVALVFAIIWEWRHPDPVVEIRLLADRNFALANIFYFLFGFTLYGSTVLIPQMLQRLFGYTATDAGLVLVPARLSS